MKSSDRFYESISPSLKPATVLMQICRIPAYYETINVQEIQKICVTPFSFWFIFSQLFFQHFSIQRSTKLRLFYSIFIKNELIISVIRTMFSSIIVELKKKFTCRTFSILDHSTFIWTLIAHPKYTIRFFLLQLTFGSDRNSCYSDFFPISFGRLLHCSKNLVISSAKI